jgi:hypothetical protein
LWECARDFQAAQIAVRAYLQSAARLKTGDGWPPFTERIERATRIAAKRGFEKIETEVVAAIEAAIAEFENDSKTGLLCHRLMFILVMQGHGDIARYAALAERLALEFAATGVWDFSERYWQVAELWNRRANDENAVLRARLAAAECNVSRAEAGLPGGKPNYGYSAHWMGRGLEALRQAKADPSRIAEIHQRFLDLQKQSLTELGTVEVDLDAIPGFRENEKKTQEIAAAHVSGLTFEQAIARFANITKPTDTVALKAQTEKQSQETIFDKIISTVALDRGGKVADTIDPSNAGAPDDAETLRKKMVQQAREIHWPMQVRWKIEPARLAFLREHAIRRDDLRFLVDANPFITQGHEGIYLRGIQAGFFGDWLTAMHFLIPQIEASLRQLLQQAGVTTSTLESDGTQKERDLNQLLWMPELDAILGPDVIFDLRGILIERFGHNMRNESAHGLMPEGAFYQEASAFFWWLTVHLCWKGYRISRRKPTSD